jgi:hypothetical protein
LLGAAATALGLAVASCSLARILLSPGFMSGNPLDRTRDPAEPTREVGNVDERENQCRNPERVVVGEQPDEAQHSNNLELGLLGFVRHMLGQMVQAKEQDAKHQNRDRQDGGRYDHQGVRLTGGRDERRQMV